jgi:hypothetical protein
MEWLAENWLWVAGGALVLFLIYLFTRPKKSSRSSRGRSVPSTRRRQPSEQEVVGVLLSKLVDALEGVVDDTVGRHYTREDRKRIAVGMVAIMTTQKISLERLVSDKSLFVAVMLKSIADLTKMGLISGR